MYYGPRIQFGPITLIILWKIIIILILLSYLLRKGKRINIYIKIGYLYSLKIWLSYGAFIYVFDTIAAFSKFIMIPLVAHFTLNYINQNNIYKFINVIKIISIYIILSSIPFLLKILEPNTTGYDLSIYGFKDSYGFAGFFQNEHSAAVNIATSILIISYFFLNSKYLKNKAFYLFLILFGLYVEYKTYVRTGYLSMLAGVYFMYFKHRNLKIKISMLFLSLFLILFAYNLFKTDKVLQMRLEDKNIYREEASEDNIGSGRLLFAKTNIENLFESNTFIVFFGLGREYSRGLMEKKIGKSLISHDGYIDALTHNGVLGLFLFLFMLYNAYIIIKKNNKSIFYNLTISIFIIFLFVTLTQSYEFYFLNIYLSILVIIINETKTIIHEKSNTS